MMKVDLVEAWEVHQRINLRLLDLVGEENLKDSYAPRVRDINKTFAHMHNTRIMWLDAMGMLPEDVKKIDKGAVPKLGAIRVALEASGVAVRGMIERVVEKGKVPSFKRSPATFVSYLIAHESHHRGQITVALRLSGHGLKPEVLYGMWEWDRE